MKVVGLKKCLSKCYVKYVYNSSLGVSREGNEVGETLKRFFLNELDKKTNRYFGVLYYNSFAPPF